MTKVNFHPNKKLNAPNSLFVSNHFSAKQRNDFHFAMSLINILCGDGEVETVPHNYSFTFNEGTSALMLREYYFYVDNLQLLLLPLYFSLNT